MNSDSQRDHQRDTASLRVLAMFFSALGAIVLLATVFELERPRAAVVNAISGSVLLSVALGMWLTARRLSAPSRP